MTWPRTGRGSGQKEWESLEGELSLKATSVFHRAHESGGPAKVGAIPIDWTLTKVLLIEAGQLEPIAKKMEDCLSGADLPQPDPETLKRELVVSLPNGLVVVLSREEFPEISVLQKEKEAAIVEWLLQARQFFRN